MHWSLRLLMHTLDWCMSYRVQVQDSIAQQAMPSGYDLEALLPMPHEVQGHTWAFPTSFTSAVKNTKAAADYRKVALDCLMSWMLICNKQREGSSRAYPVDNGDCVVEAEHEEEGPTEGDAGQQNVPDPPGALHLSVVRGRHVPADAGCQGIQHYQSCEQAAPVVGVEDPHTGQDEDEDG